MDTTDRYKYKLRPKKWQSELIGTGYKIKKVYDENNEACKIDSNKILREIPTQFSTKIPHL